MVSQRLGWQVWAALGLVYLIWGSTYFAIRIAVRTLPPLYSASARFLLAGAILIGLAAVTRQLRGVGRRGVLLAAVPGILLVAGGNGAVVLAERTIASSFAALVVALSPLLMAVMTMGLNRRITSGRALLGLVLGLAGLVLLIRPQPGGHLDPVGVSLILLSPISWAAGSVFAGRRPTGMGAAATSGFQMLAGGVVLGLGGLVTREPAPVLNTAAAPSLWALLYLLVFGSLVGFSAYSWLLGKAPISLVSTYAYVNPVVAITLGVAFLGEPFGWGELVAAAVILGGVVLIVTAQAGAKAGYSRASGEARPTPSPGTGGGPGPEPAGSRAVR